MIDDNFNVNTPFGPATAVGAEYIYANTRIVTVLDDPSRWACQMPHCCFWKWEVTPIEAQL